MGVRAVWAVMLDREYLGNPERTPMSMWMLYRFLLLAILLKNLSVFLTASFSGFKYWKENLIHERELEKDHIR